MNGAMLVNVVMSGLGAASCAVFAVAYQLMAPWWRSSEGRNLMGSAAAIGTFLAYTVLIWLWPHGWEAATLRGVRVAVIVAIVLLMIQRTELLVRAQRGRSPQHDRTGV